MPRETSRYVRSPALLPPRPPFRSRNRRTGHQGGAWQAQNPQSLAGRRRPLLPDETCGLDRQRCLDFRSSQRTKREFLRRTTGGLPLPPIRPRLSPPRGCRRQLPQPTSAARPGNMRTRFPLSSIGLALCAERNNQATVDSKMDEQLLVSSLAHLMQHSRTLAQVTIHTQTRRVTVDRDLPALRLGEESVALRPVLPRGWRSGFPGASLGKR